MFLLSESYREMYAPFKSYLALGEYAKSDLDIKAHLNWFNRGTTSLMPTEVCKM